MQAYLTSFWGHYTIPILCLFLCGNCNNTTNVEEAIATTPPPHIVFVTGDEEYRSEESMPMLARIAERELGAKVSVCYAIDSAGFINPNRLDHIAGLEVLKDADLMVLFTRFRQLPDEERAYITNYVESGRPIVGFRTSTHAFLYPDPKDTSLLYWNNEWPTKVFGQQWITHHGHFDDGTKTLTAVGKALEKGHSPILRGIVDSFQTYSWLYHVDGGDWQLSGDSDPLLIGRSLRSKHAAEGRLDQFPITNPVAWTKTYTGKSGQAARVFFTTLGHPYDFKLTPMRRLALQGIYWALGKEAEIPTEGLNVSTVGPYNPNNSGFGEKFKIGMKPGEL